MTATPRRPSLWEQATSTRGGRVAVVVAIVAICLLVATAAVALASSARQDRLAATSASTDQQGTAKKDDNNTKGKNAPGNGQGKSQGNGPGNGPGNGDLSSIPGRLGGMLHGEVTRPTAAGGTETLLVQSGSVTASSATEVTVKSTDGFTETYAVSDTTTVRGPAKAAGLGVGTEVTVVAAKDGKRALLVASRGKPS